MKVWKKMVWKPRASPSAAEMHTDMQTIIDRIAKGKQVYRLVHSLPRRIIQ